MTEVTHDPFRIELRGESITLTDDEARAILKTLHEQSSGRMRAEEAAAREAGQVWYAVYWRYGRREEEECFSLAEAASYLSYGDEEGDHGSDSIRCPDGTVYTRADISGYDWSTLPALRPNERQESGRSTHPRPTLTDPDRQFPRSGEG